MGKFGTFLREFLAVMDAAAFLKSDTLPPDHADWTAFQAGMVGRTVQYTANAARDSRRSIRVIAEVGALSILPGLKIL